MIALCPTSCHVSRYMARLGPDMRDYLPIWQGHLSHWVASAGDIPIYIFRYEDLLLRGEEALRYECGTLGFVTPWSVLLGVGCRRRRGVCDHRRQLFLFCCLRRRCVNGRCWRAAVFCWRFFALVEKLSGAGRCC